MKLLDLKSLSSEEISLDRLPPNSPSAERGMLGCMLINAPENCEAFLSGSPGVEVFYDLRHATVCKAILAVFGAGKGVDTITVMQHLQNEDRLDMVGGVAFLGEIQDEVGSAANFEYYMEIVVDKYRLRKINEVCSGFAKVALSEQAPSEEVASNLAAEAARLAQEASCGADRVKGAQEVVREVIEQLEAESMLKGGITGIASGIPDYDNLFSGLQPGWVNVVAARPGQGKTSLMCNIVSHIALTQNIPSLIFSLEMPNRAFFKRICHANSRVDSRVVRNGWATQDDMKRLFNATVSLSKAPLYIIDSKGLTAPKMFAIARSYVRNHGVRFVGLDYIQKIAAHKANEKKTYEIAETSNILQEMTQSLNLSTIFLAQLNRESEQTPNTPPRLKDLAHSGSIETDADTVSFLWRDPRQELSQPTWSYKLITEKCRDGETGITDLVFFKKFTRFESAARE